MPTMPPLPIAHQNPTGTKTHIKKKKPQINLDQNLDQAIIDKNHNVTTEEAKKNAEPRRTRTPNPPSISNPYPIRPYPPLPLGIGHNRKKKKKKNTHTQNLELQNPEHKTRPELQPTRKKMNHCDVGLPLNQVLLFQNPQHRRTFVLRFCKQNLNPNLKTLEDLSLKRVIE